MIDEFVELAVEIAANATRNPGTGYAAPSQGQSADEGEGTCKTNRSCIRLS